MADLGVSFTERLAETFKGDNTQLVTANKLHVVQGNISKWLRGESVPTAETLLLIAKTYRVSVDWLLGLSDQKVVDSVCVEHLTYEQIALILHRLIELGSIEIPDLTQFESKSSSDVDFKPEDEEEESQVTKEPKYDSDLIKINDRALSYILRTRWKLCELGEDMMMEKWVADFVKVFTGIQMLHYDEKTQAALDAQPWSTYRAGDWASKLKEMSNMTEAQIDNMTKTKKEGRSYGR